MLPRMCSQLACMNIDVNTPSYQGSGWIGIVHRDVARPVDGARVVAVLEDVHVDAGRAELPEPDERGSRRSGRSSRPASTASGRCPSAAASSYAAASASRTRSAAASSSSVAPVTSWRISSAVGFWPSDHSSRMQRARVLAREPRVAELLAQERAQLRLERPGAQVVRRVEAVVDVREIVGVARVDLQRVAEQLDVARPHRRRRPPPRGTRSRRAASRSSAAAARAAASRPRPRTRAGAGSRAAGRATPGRSSGARAASPSPR